MTMPTIEEAAPDPTTSTTIGAVGQATRWSVSPWGAITPWSPSDSAPLDWCVAADDRWHVPVREPTIRQRRIEGTPVIETRLRVPGGDAVHRAWSVPDRGGMVVVEVENDSPLPFAVAFSGRSLITERVPSDVPIQGIDLPADAIVLPVGHHAQVRVAVGAGDAVPVPTARSVVGGWIRFTERASRLVLPDDALVEAVTAARCDLALEGPVDPASDPAGFVIDVSELVRTGDPASHWIEEIVGPVELLARRVRTGLDADTAEAIGAARRVAVAADDRRAVGDLDRMTERLGRPVLSAGDPASSPSFADVRRGPSCGRFVRAIEQRLVDGGRLFPNGLPAGWWGSGVEVHGVPSGPASSLSFAVRWHGERPAVLWEQTGAAVELSAPAIDPAWTSVAPAGEALLAPCPEPDRRLEPPIAPDVASEPEAGGPVPDDGGSFS